MDLEGDLAGASVAAEGSIPPSSPRDGREPAMLPNLPSEDRSKGWEVVMAGGRASAYDDLSVFPPSDHEGLFVDHAFSEGGDSGVAPPLPAAPCASLSSPFTSSSRSGTEVRRAVWCEGRGKPLVELARRTVRSGYKLLQLMLLRARERGGFTGVKNREVVWSSAAVAGMAAVLLVLIRRRYHRERLRLLLLIQEKDQM